MVSTVSAGVTLTVLGLAAVISTGAATAVIPAVFGLILLGLGALMRRPERARSAAWTALGVGVLGLVAPLANLARVIGAGAFTLNAATFSNATMALICAAYIGFWVWERRSYGQDRASR